MRPVGRDRRLPSSGWRLPPTVYPKKALRFPLTKDRLDILARKSVWDTEARCNIGYKFVARPPVLQKLPDYLGAAVIGREAVGRGVEEQESAIGRKLSNPRRGLVLSHV